MYIYYLDFPARLQRTKLQAELDEVGGLKTIGSQENASLRRDNLLLSDQVTELQAKVRKLSI